MTAWLDDASASPLITAEHLTELTDLAAFLYAKLGLGTDVELAITLIDDAHMERLHLEWMQLPGTTDVMSFPMDELRPGTAQERVESGTLGDIVISPSVAADQADSAGHSVADELCLLATHGVLHLLGHDHDDDQAHTEMFGLQKALLEEFLGREAPMPTEADTTGSAPRDGAA